MKRHVVYCALSACFLSPWNAFAASPSLGISASNDVYPLNAGDSPKTLQVAVAITEEMGLDDLPLSFFSWYQVSASTKGRVKHRVSIYRGHDRLWTSSRMVKLEEMDFTADSWNTFCDAYTDGLLPGDIVVFNFGLRGHSLSKTGNAQMQVQLGHREMWTVGTYPWDSGLFECP